VTQKPGRDFDEFYRAEYPRLLCVLSAADLGAADALQEAFTKAASAWPRISKYDDPAAWVRRVAVHELLNERRSLHRRDAAVETLRVVSVSEPVDREHLLDLAAAIDARPSPTTARSATSVRAPRVRGASTSVSTVPTRRPTAGRCST
jgi:DNA-directed RNA polymerase specialized sigma24 family protein